VIYRSESDDFVIIRFISSRQIEWYQICLILITGSQNITH